MDKTYVVEVPDVVRRFKSMYYAVGLWNGKGKVTVLQVFYFTFFSAFNLSSVVGVSTSENTDNAVFLTVIVLIIFIQSYRLYFIIGKQNQILEFMSRVCVNSTDNYDAFRGATNKIRNMCRLALSFLGISYTLCVGVVVLPVIRKKLLFDIAFPWDYRIHEFAFWMAYGLVAGSYILSITLLIFVCMIWYMMQIFVVKYDILGKEFQSLGKEMNGENRTTSQGNRASYIRRLIEGIKRLETINEYAKNRHAFKNVFENHFFLLLLIRQLDEFESTFSSLFLLQIITSSMCICGATFVLSFVSQ